MSELGTGSGSGSGSGSGRTPRRLLPLLNAQQGGRAALTCRFKCGDACAHPVPNTTGNTYFGDVAARAVSRRGVLRGGALGAVVAGLGAAGIAPAAAVAPTADAARHGHRGKGAISFTAVAPNTRDELVVPPNYDSEVLISWGDGILPGAPAFDIDKQSEAAQLRQFGYNNDMVWFLPVGSGRERALLVANHEYTDEILMFRGYTDGAAATERQVRIAMAAHGLSVVEVERIGHSARWRPTSSRRRYNRRIHVNTEMRLTGPAAGHSLVRTNADRSGTRVYGTFANCAGGQTPWGTVLTAEENFNSYFGASGDVPEEVKASNTRYGIAVAETTTERGWERFDKRFDITAEPHEPHRFGWVVEIDPYDPDSVPRKRTHLGRFKHEAANTVITDDGRVVVYMGDDERFDYLYKFVSRERIAKGHSPHARRHNMSLLDHGTLYVARFTGDSDPAEIDGTGKLPDDGEFDGSGRWIPLLVDGESRVPGMSGAEVAVFTRLAADKVGPTKMDRPEDVEASPVTGNVYIACTNNTKRQHGQQDEANPRVENKHGHIIELVEKRGDGASTSFRWSIPLVAGDPEDPATYFAGYDKSKVSAISCPDNIAFDAAGNLWLATDGNALGHHDGMYAMPLAGRERGHLRRFTSLPNGAECCGPRILPDQRTALLAVQHPGEVDGATVDKPASTWPFGGQPRPSVVQIWKTSGSDRIGS